MPYRPYVLYPAYKTGYCVTFVLLSPCIFLVTVIKQNADEWWIKWITFKQSYELIMRAHQISSYAPVILRFTDQKGD